MLSENVVNILLVEDDDVAAEKVERAFRKARIANPIIRAVDGIDALNKLRGTDGVDQLDRPYIILLDLRMPRMDGLQFLEEIRSDGSLLDSVIFVLTTSDADQDRTMAYEKQIAGYIVKSKAGENFTDLIEMLDAYWRIVELPDN